jgi:2-polyprenyl-6-methoxyphenol hydroxylase-like FAD-dependent oxidoreductase
MKAIDAVVIGGGPAGATAAFVLARAGFEVAVVEKASYPRPKVCGEFISATTWPLLHEMGVASRLDELAGPPVRRVGLFAGDVVVDAPMPAPGAGEAWGRAVGREHLDTALLEAAAQAGAKVFQPWSALAVEEDAAACRVTFGDRDGRTQSIEARAVVAAHGSWEPGSLPSHPAPHRHAASDLLGFKAHFTGTHLAPGLMPLVLFPGGYGGMVQADGGRTSFSCCVRRDALGRCRRAHRGLAAGEALLLHIAESCRGVREALAGARREAAWLSAGPIRPGVRMLARGRVFSAGNLAGEAHPLVAEGISMAIQSGWLAARALAAGELTAAGLAAARARYAREWRGHFENRVRASSLFALLTTSRATAAASVAAMGGVPAILTWGARASGKAHSLAQLA